MVANCRDWSAEHFRRPPHSLFLVRGKCEFPTTGYSVELRRSEPQGTYPGELSLDLVIQVPKPTDPVQEVITTVIAEYQEETETDYDAVTIREYISVPRR
jgi:hypothetical protein